MDERSSTTIFYPFLHFALEVVCTDHWVISAKFNHLDVKREIIVGKNLLLANEVIAQLNEYCKHPFFKFTLPLKFSGSLHQLKLWQLIRQIPSGKTLTYATAAALIGSASRAIGGACGKNPLAIFIPCHRIIAANNKLGGFNSGNPDLGIGIKDYLLQHEGIFLS